MDASVSQTHGLPPTKQNPKTSDDEFDGDSVSANGTDTEAMQDHPALEKRPHKARKPKQLTKYPFVIRRVNGVGAPVSPEKAASGYNNSIGVIVRETVNITCLNLRAKEQGSIREALFNKLFNRYCFNFHGVDDQSVQRKKRVKHNALRMMAKALNTWQNMANSKRHEDFESYIKKRWPQIQENDWQRFVASHADSVF